MDLRLYGRWRNFQHLLNAVAAVIAYGYPARDLAVIGVTGTDGKTTTCHLIYEILKTAGMRTALISTIGAFLEDEKINTGFHTTTPDPGIIQQFLKKAKERGITHVVLEATSHGLDQHRVLGCNFKIGVLTNITHEHLDYHKTFEKYQWVKSKLFWGVKTAVLNLDDSSFSYIKEKTNPNADIISYSTQKKAQLWASSITSSIHGLAFTVHEGKQTYGVHSKLLGLYNVSNILAAVGVARALGIEWKPIQEAINTFFGIPGRLERIDEGQRFSVFVDFAHTPNALKNVLQEFRVLKPQKTSKLIVVFGCPGERDVEKRPMMGRVAVENADFIVLTTDDPRHEDPERIIDAITRGIRQNATMWDGVADWRKRGKWVIRILDRGEAIAFAIQKLAKPGDVVVLAGQGHQQAMPFGDVEIPWSDQEAARVALKGGVKRLKD